MERVFKNKQSLSLPSLLQFPGISVKGIFLKDDQISIFAKVTSKYGICPTCGLKSKRLHSYYRRKLNDLPIISRSVVIELYNCGR